MKSARLDLRIEEDLKARVEVEAEKQGQKITTFVERALRAALAAAEAREKLEPHLVAHRDFVANHPLQDAVPPPLGWTLEARGGGPPVRPARAFVKTPNKDAMERQRKLNEGKG